MNFEQIKKIDKDGIEFWEARELMLVLEYSEWRNFLNVIEKAKTSCTTSKQCVADHFVDINKMILLGKGGEKSVQDYKLSRYACYLIAQNGDPSKESIASAQTYFAVQTRKQEMNDITNDDEKRIFIREELTNENKKLFKTAKEYGVMNFGKFNDAGYLGLYGLSSKQIQKKKKIGKDKLLDRAGSTELAANLFRVTQTDEQLKYKLNAGEKTNEAIASQNHFVVGKKVRKAIKDIGGIMPENLPAQEHIEGVKKKIKPKITKEQFLAELDAQEEDWKKNGGISWESVMLESKNHQ